MPESGAIRILNLSGRNVHAIQVEWEDAYWSLLRRQTPIDNFHHVAPAGGSWLWPNTGTAIDQAVAPPAGGYGDTTTMRVWLDAWDSDLSHATPLTLPRGGPYVELLLVAAHDGAQVRLRLIGVLPGGGTRSVDQLV
jgi:hypothetical protein